MKRLIAAASAAFALGAASPAFAYTNATTTTAVYLRTGPDFAYPPAVVLPYGTPVVVLGCLNGWQWCDVTWGPHRGWVYGSYLATYWQNRPAPWYYAAPRYNVPIITFNFGPYWDSHYRHRDFYRHRDRWDRWDHGRRRWR